MVKQEIRYDTAIVNKFPELFDLEKESALSSIIFYIINSKYRTAVNLSKWLNSLLEETDESVQIALEDITTHEDYDLQMIEILRWVQSHIKYVGDMQSWQTPEYWQTPVETLVRREGDCEDGAILIYILARLKGVPVNRLMLFCGGVTIPGTTNLGGHCWLAYKPNNYPIDWTFLDWCYYYDRTDIATRPKYVAFGKEIYSDKYKTLWFAFDDQNGYKELRSRYRR